MICLNLAYTVIEEKCPYLLNSLVKSEAVWIQKIRKILVSSPESLVVLLCHHLIVSTLNMMINQYTDVSKCSTFSNSKNRFHLSDDTLQFVGGYVLTIGKLITTGNCVRELALNSGFPFYSTNSIVL